MSGCFRHVLIRRAVLEVSHLLDALSSILYDNYVHVKRGVKNYVYIICVKALDAHALLLLFTCLLKAMAF